MVTLAPPAPSAASLDAPVAVQVQNLSLWYGAFKAVEGVTIPFREKQITAIIGPSGCGKSTVLRCMNRMNELIPGVRVEGSIFLHGQDMYARDADPVEVRRRVGMVFQKPNPFPKSIFDNIAFGPRINGFKGSLEELVQRSLEQAALWDEVKDRLQHSALGLSGGQQQRLCIARALAIEPEVILMDEPCSALDPIATYRIEELMVELKKEYTIAIVTHNMQQASRTSDYTAFMLAQEDRIGRLIEFAPTSRLFTNPSERRTEDYITGRFG